MLKKFKYENTDQIFIFTFKHWRHGPVGINDLKNLGIVQ